MTTTHPTDGTYRLHDKVGVSFYNLLMTDPAYQANWKAVSPAQAMLKWVAKWQHANDGKPVQIYWETIAKLFQPYCNGNYTTYTRPLEALGLLEVDHTFKPEKTNLKAECKKYFVSDKGMKLLANADWEYLKKLHLDPKVRRRNQQSISKRKVVHKRYDDFILDYIHQTLCGLSYDFDAVEAFRNDPSLSDDQKHNINASLLAIREKDFLPLKVNDADGRIVNDLALMKSDLRPFLYFNGNPYRGTFDIRACHPTYFSAYIISNAIPSFFSYLPSSSSLPTSYPFHYDYHNGDNIDPRMLKYIISDDKATQQPEDIKRYRRLIIEHTEWVKLFCHSTIDPRSVIAKELGMEDDIKAIKDGLNETINGSGKHLAIKRWIKKRFPLLYAEWQKGGYEVVKNTGCNIAKMFEVPLMTDQQLYRYAEGMELRLSYEYDGGGVFGKNDGKTLKQQVDMLCKYITHQSKQRWGIPVVVKNKVK